MTQSTALLASHVPVPALPSRPYPGLRPFTADEDAVFFGREPIIDEIIDLLARRCLILVHGSSGSGKSSLILAGVLPRLARQHRRHGWRWRTASMRPGGGPLWNLARALADLEGGTPSPSRVDQLRLSFDRSGAKLAEIVTNLVGMEQERLCLLVDQFEEVFRYASETSCEESQLFVDLITTVLKEESASPVRVILTMRSEFLGDCARLPGLAGVVNTAQYLLPPMATASLERAIRRPAELYDGEVSIELADRLIADVQGSQDELPLIQHGLMRLWDLAGAAAGRTQAPRRLDLRLYEAHGPLARLLDRHAEDVAVAAAPDQSGRRAVEHVFRALTDINANGQAIRRPQTVQSLIAVTGAERGQLVSILDAFRSDSVSFVTPYVPASLENDTMIDISHEALIRCWNSLAAEPDGWLHREFRDGLIWRSLLSQAEIFEKDQRNVLGPATLEDREHWLKDRTPAWSKRYGGGWSRVERLMTASRRAADRQRLRDRVMTSTLGALTAILLGSSIFAGIQWQNSVDRGKEVQRQLDRSNQALARGIWSDLVLADPRILTPRERTALWSLARSDKAIRGRVLMELESVGDHALRFSARPDVVARALGLDWPSPTQAQSVLAAVLKEASGTTGSVTPDRLKQTVQVLAGKLTDVQAQQALDAVLQAMRPTTDSVALRGLTQAMQALPGKLTDVQAQQALDPLLQAMRGTSGSAALRDLAEAVQALASKLTDVQAQQALDQLPQAMRGTADSAALRGLAQALQALPGKLTDVQAQQALDPLLQAMRGTSDSEALREAVQALATKLTDVQAQQALDALLRTMPRTTEPKALRGLAPAIDALPGKLTDAQAQQALDPLLQAMRRTTDSGTLEGLAAAVKALAGKLTDAQAQRALDPVLQAMRDPLLQQMRRMTDSRTLEGPAAAVKALAGKLTDAQAQQALGAVLQAMKATTDLGALQHLAAAMQALPVRLTGAQAQQALDQVLREPIRSTTQPVFVFPGLREASMAAAVQALADKLTGAQAQQALDAVLRAMRGATDPFSPPGLAAAVQALAGKLNDVQAQQALDAVLQAMQGTTDWSALRGLAAAVQALPGKLTDGQAQQALDRVLQAPRPASTFGPLFSREDALAEAVQALAGKLTDVQAQQALDPVLRAMRTTIDSDALEDLGEAVQVLAGKLTDVQAQQALDPVLQAMRSTTNRVELQGLAAAVQVLAGKLTDVQAQQVLDPVLQAMQGTTGAGALYGLAAAAQSLAGKLTDAQARQVLATSRLQSAFGWAATSDESAAWAGAIATLLRRAGEPHYVGAIVELLKYPMAAGPATEVLLGALHQAVPAAPGPEAGLPANLRWIAETYPRIDLLSAPPCVEPLQKDLACP